MIEKEKRKKEKRKKRKEKKGRVSRWILFASLSITTLKFQTSSLPSPPDAVFVARMSGFLSNL